MDSKHPGNVVLYGYYRSSCSARLRIALAVKGIGYKAEFVNIKDGFHLQPDYIAINASRTVPTLYLGETKVTQSVAALELLEEAFPNSTPLLPPPSNPIGRAQVRTMVNIIADDIQPPTNMKVLKRIGKLQQDTAQWARDFMGEGFRAYEEVLTETAGTCSYGDQITLADTALVPAVWNAERYGLDLTPYPNIVKVYKHLSTLPEIKTSHWQAQPDCPEELR
ncbi:maleylacetoacetate isomerase [Acrodontium crateriforme]|uniref:Maleylacetoacetate isomerase n=1 Tax=Acrodontium crateriforme TaxID=150365 RepID=A0AAQ3RAT0_9PEZI|nr:maleylacetoacetate isomerase [Acrodontium crateriforme]